MSIELITVLLFASLVVLLILGLPVAFCLGSLGIIFTIFLWGPQGLFNVGYRIISVMNYFTIVAMPLFIFMGMMLERSGIADDLYTMFYRWSGRLRGGLAAGTVVICAMFAAMVGLTGPATLTMGVIALPSMFKRGYQKAIPIGSIMAGGALGFLIPPSIVMIFYSLFAGESVGRLFAGGILPGLLLTILFIGYIIIRSAFQPNLCPALPEEERATWGEKFTSLRAIILPGLLIVGVLGAIFTGLCTPTEASAIGALGSIICAAVHRKLNWQILKEALYRTFGLCGMVMWIFYGAMAFSGIYIAMGASDLVASALTIAGIGRWGTLIVMQLSFFVMGCFLDDFTILILAIPIYVPIVASLGFDTLWFGILWVINMQMAYLTPPFGWNLFYMKSVAPKDVVMGDIYRSVWPFVLLQGIGLALCMLFPQIVLWLPNMLFK